MWIAKMTLLLHPGKTLHGTTSQVVDSVEASRGGDELELEPFCPGAPIVPGSLVNPAAKNNGVRPSAFRSSVSAPLRKQPATPLAVTFSI